MSSTVPTTTNRALRIDKKITRLQQACCDVWDILTDEGSKKIRRLPSLSSGASYQYQRPLATVSHQYSFSAPILPPPPGFRDGDRDSPPYSHLAARGHVNENRYSYPPASSRLGDAGHLPTAIDVISPADEFRDLATQEQLNIRPWESADGAELVYEVKECARSDSEEADDVGGAQGFLRPSPKPRKALSEGSWPIFFAQSDSEGWMSSTDAQIRTSTVVDDTKQQQFSTETVCSYTKNIPEAANVLNVAKHSHLPCSDVVGEKTSATYMSSVIPKNRVRPPEVISDAHPEVDSVWKRKIQRFANTVQLSVNSSSTPGSSSSSPCLSMDELEDGAATPLLPTVKVPILSGLVRAEMEQRAAAQRRLLEKAHSPSRSTFSDVVQKANLMRQMRSTSHTSSVGPSDESDQDDDKDESDDVFVENSVYPSTSVEMVMRPSERSSSDDLSPVDITGRLIQPRESRGSSTSHSESVATVIERTLSTGRLLIRSSASTLSSMDSDTSIGGAGGGSGAAGMISESIEEQEDEQIESTSGSSGTSGGSIGTSWQVTEEGCFYLPDVNVENANSGEAKVMENKNKDDVTKPVVVIEVTEDGTRRVISGDDYDELITASPAVSKMKSNKEGVAASLSDHSGTENGDTTSQSSLETVMTVLEKKKVKPPVPPKPPNLRKTPPTPPSKPCKQITPSVQQQPVGKVHETGGYVLLSLQSFSQDDEEEIVEVQEKPTPSIAQVRNTNISGQLAAATKPETKSSGEVKRVLSPSSKIKIETKEESCGTENFEQEKSNDSGKMEGDDDDDDDNDCDSKTLTPEASRLSNSELDTTANSFSYPNYYSVHASTQTELVPGPNRVKNKVRRRHTITNPLPTKPMTASQSTMTSSLQTDMEESGGTLDDLPSIVSDEVGAEEEEENPNVNRGESPLMLRKTNSFHSMSSSGSSSALGGSSDGLCGGGNFQTPDHTLTDISDIPSHYTNLDLDTVQVTIQEEATTEVNKLISNADNVPNLLSSGNVTPQTTPSPLLSPNSPNQITSSLTSGYEELRTEVSAELSDLHMREFDSVNFSDKEKSQSEDDTSKTLCPSPSASKSLTAGNAGNNKVEGSSTSDVDTDETLGKGDSNGCEPQKHLLAESGGEMLLTTNDNMDNRPRSTSPILLMVDESSAVGGNGERRTPSLTIVRSGSGNSGSSGGSPLLEFEVEVLVDELFRDFSKTVEDACRSGGKSPTPPLLSSPSLSITDGGKLQPSNDLDVISRCSSASPKPPASPVKRTKLFSISMVQRSRESTSPSKDNDGQRLTVKSHHQQRHSFDLTLAMSNNTNEFLSTSNISTSKRYHSLELPTQTTIEIPHDRTTSPVNQQASPTTLSPNTSVDVPVETEKKEASPKKTIVYQPVVHEPIIAELMNRAARQGSKAREIGWQRIESIPSELYYITTVEDVSEDFGTCIITTPLEPTPVTIVEDPSKVEKKSEKPVLLSTKSTEKKTKAEGTTAPCPSFKAVGGKAGVWSPGSSPASTPPTQTKAVKLHVNTQESVDKNSSTVATSPVWKPSSPGKLRDSNKPEFKSVKLDTNHKPIAKAQENGVNNVYPPPAPFANSSSNVTPSSEEIVSVSRGDRNPPAIPPKTLSLKRSTSADSNQPIYANITYSPDASPPAFTRINPTGSGLPPSQNPTVTLLQKARERRVPKEAVYIDHKMNSKEDFRSYSQIGNNENRGQNRWLNDQFVVKSEEYYDDRKVTHLEPLKYDGIGPTVRGVPISLCTGVKDENKGEWYKRMYKSLHRSSEPEGRPYLGRGGYMSEPEPERNEEYGSRRYGTLDRRKNRNEYYMYEFGNGTQPKKQPNVWNPPSARYSSDIYKNQPKRIEDYEPGHSSIAEMEAKMQGNRQNDVPLYRPPVQDRQYFLKDGYESDSTLVYHKRGPPDTLSPAEQRAWYREFQKGGDIPLTGFRRPAPDRPEDPPHRYQDSEVNIHYRSPVRNLEKDYVSDEEIRRKQEWMMKQFYEEERRKKLLQEITDIENRRHADNFIPSQKSPIPLDRYDNLYEDSNVLPIQSRTPEPKSAGKALHGFRALSPRELSFNKGDIILIHRKVDKNWYEGEHHGHIGIFPINHVEIIPYESIKVTTKKQSEGQGRVKYNFQAQTNLELSLVKGETVILTRKVDNNWYEGRIGSLKGIFPSSYVDVLIEPGNLDSQQSSKPVASPVSHSLIKNGSHVSPKPSPENTYNQPNYYNQRTSSNYTETTRRYGSSNKSSANRLFDDRKLPLDQTLHIQTQTEPIRYRAIYNYKPQNDDELELHDGDTVYVMEKCDDGWYVGSSQRTGLFGTFPGNYVERI